MIYSEKFIVLVVSQFYVGIMTRSIKDRNVFDPFPGTKHVKLSYVLGLTEFHLCHGASMVTTGLSG